MKEEFLFCSLLETTTKAVDVITKVSELFRSMVKIGKSVWGMH